MPGRKDPRKNFPWFNAFVKWPLRYSFLTAFTAILVEFFRSRQENSRIEREDGQRRP
jgi:hypothetical protein